MDFELELDPVRIEEIAELEEACGCTLPQDYKDLLGIHNGGRPHRCVVAGPGGPWILNELFGIGAQPGYVSDIREFYSILEGRVPRHFVPIGDTPGGDYFLLAAKESGTEGVFIYDHENEPADEDLAWFEYPNLYKVAPSFSAFLESLAEA